MFLKFSNLVFNVLGPPLAGVVVDHTGSLCLPMVISAAVMGAATIMAALTGAVDTGHRRGNTLMKMQMKNRLSELDILC